MSDAKNRRSNNIIDIMKNLYLSVLVLSLLSTLAFAQNGKVNFDGETHLKNIKQLTFGGENAEAYFSFDGKKLIFQSKRDGRG